MLFLKGLVVRPNQGLCQKSAAIEAERSFTPSRQGLRNIWSTGCGPQKLFCVPPDDLKNVSVETKSCLDKLSELPFCAISTAYSYFQQNHLRK